MHFVSFHFNHRCWLPPKERNDSFTVYCYNTKDNLMAHVYWVLAVCSARVSKSWHYWQFGPDRFCYGGCPLHHRVFSNILGLDPLDASSYHPPVVTTKNISRHCQVSPRGQNCPQLRTTLLGPVRDDLHALFNTYNNSLGLALLFLF